MVSLLEHSPERVSVHGIIGLCQINETEIQYNGAPSPLKHEGRTLDLHIPCQAESHTEELVHSLLHPILDDSAHNVASHTQQCNVSENYHTHQKPPSCAVG